VRRLGIGAGVLAVVALIAAAPAAAAEPATSLPDVEDEVMCPICGTLLELSEAPQADRQRAFIRKEIARGRSKDQIKDALVAEFGEEVLALPDDSGFGLSAYLIPIVAFLAAVAALAVGAVRWRRGAAASPPAVQAGHTAVEDAERLEADLTRYDL
jgi:cytochrome c-type biogenesis protein CcmH/NrfF